MYELKRHDEVVTGIHDVPAELQSLLETSARYFGLDAVPPELLCRHACTIPGEGAEWTENQNPDKRGAA